MASIKGLGIFGAAAFCSMIATSGAFATAYTIGGVAVADLGITGGTTPQVQRTVTGAPTTLSLSSAFPPQPFTGTSDPDKGGDDDAFFNFSGLRQGTAGLTTYGDALIATWAGGTVGSTVTNLTATTIGNLDGVEFHVEDSSGSGTVTGHFTETLTIGGNSASFDVPFTLNFGVAGDSFQINAFDDQVCVGNCGNGRYFVISGGTALMGTTSAVDDDWAFETNLFGCVTQDESTATKNACQATLGTVNGFVANDPPPAVPEPSSLAILGFAGAAFGAIRRRVRR